ncbi:HEAT repeat domain-containing protein [Herbaspirillum huttiense]|uniref:HEAT repeat domain-containing protein n=2 Tax=Herbaspirillum huttiense TaxID=863372 RepID=A0AAJ2LRX8_9BURK|nr:HEAT repeat domain-containing protein [Herbaspirillum huttiense]MDR9834515.1 HEAT repeat domain-containing protein [Herbaspirillum huttiense]UWE18770.1 HEAT repeat domain-containing protein [Herbaspirillum huttiense]
MSSPSIAEVTRATALASLQAADPALRRSAAQTLAGQPEAVPVILAALERESSLAVRIALLDSLAATPGDEAVQALAGCLRSEDAWLRNAAIDLLRGMPEQVAPVIAHMLIDPETDIRILAVGILDTLRHARVEDWLLQLIDAETDVNVCGAALEVLTTIGTPAAIGPVTTLMRRFADEPYITFAGRLLLNRLGRGA